MHLTFCFAHRTIQIVARFLFASCMEKQQMKMLLLWVCALSLQFRQGSPCISGDSQTVFFICYSHWYQNTTKRLDVALCYFSLLLENQNWLVFRGLRFRHRKSRLGVSEHRNRSIACLIQVMEAAFVRMFLVRFFTEGQITRTLQGKQHAF